MDPPWVAWVDQLERHERWRASGAATITTLAMADAAEVAGAAAAAESWLREQAQGRVAAMAAVGEEAQDPDAVTLGLVQAWLACAVERRVLLFAVLHRAAQCDAAERSLDEIARRWWRGDRARRAELSRGLLVSLEAAGESAAVLALCERILGEEGAPSLDALIDATGAVAVAASPEQTLATIAAVLPGGRLPGLIIPIKGSSLAVEHTASALDRLLAEVPQLTAIAIAEASLFARYFQGEPESRGKALLRSGYIAATRSRPDATPAPAPGPDNVLLHAEITRPVDVPETGNATIGTGEGAEDILAIPEAERYERALATGLEASACPEDVKVQHLARSQAELLLFTALENYPVTRGFFALNRLMPIKFGPRLMEIDLIAATLHIAVEVDGYYHFKDSDAYRRDRRKDLELQLQGYLVVRVLAEDVLTDRDKLVQIIARAVTKRRAQINPTP